MDAGRAPQRVRRRHLADEHADLLIDAWTAVRVSNVGPIGGGATRDAIARRCPAARAPRPCASSARFASRRSKTVGRAPGDAGGWSCVSSPSAVAAAPGSPTPIPDVRGAPTPAPGRSRAAAPACVDRAWAPVPKSTRTSSGKGQVSAQSAGRRLSVPAVVFSCHSPPSCRIIDRGRPS
jgi:hypothetical protein